METQQEGRWVMTAYGRKWLTKEFETKLERGEVPFVMEYREIEEAEEKE